VKERPDGKMNRILHLPESVFDMPCRTIRRGDLFIRPVMAVGEQHRFTEERSFNVSSLTVLSE